MPMPPKPLKPPTPPKSLHSAPRFRPLLAACALALAALLLPAAPRAGAERFSGEATNVVAVEVPVEVVKDGEPVRGLTANDFEISEGRKKLKITGFDVVDLATTRPGQAAAPLAAAARRHFLLLFDLSFSEPKSILKARQAAKALVTNSLHPTDLVAVATYSTAKGPQLALGFTADRQQIAAAIETLGVAKPTERTQVADPLRLVYESELNSSNNNKLAAGGNANVAGAKADAEAELLDSLKGLTDLATGQDRRNQVNRVVAFSRSIADLGRMMANVDGRKYVVYLSEGFDSSLLTGTTATPEDQAQDARSHETTPWASSTEGAGTGDIKTLNQMEKLYEEFRRADCIIQAVDIGGLRGQGDQGYVRPNGKETLFAMAKETGGELYENWNDLGGAMGQMLKRTSVTYVLTVQPEDLKLDGQYHKIKVELKNSPRGTRVVSRPGYYAPRPFAQRNPLERVLDAADTIIGGVESGALQTAVLAAPFHLSAGPTAYVPVVVEVDGPGLLANLQGEVVPAEIYAYALDGTGAVRDFFSQNLGLALGKVGPQLKAGGLKFFGHLDLPPGEYSVRVLVRNSKTGAYGLKVVPVSVPAFGQTAGPVLLPPFFPEPPGKWLMTREAPRGNAAAQNVPYPFMMREQPYIPASRPVLGSGQDAQVSLVVYNLGAGDVKADAKVLAADGKEVGGAELKVTDRERGGSATPDRLTASFKAPELQPGEYRLQVTLTDGGGARQTSTIPFVVAKSGARG